MQPSPQSLQEGRSFGGNTGAEALRARSPGSWQGWASSLVWSTPPSPAIWAEPVLAGAILWDLSPSMHSATSSQSL